MAYAALLDFAAAFVFGLTGGIVASRAQLDIVGFVFVAGLTAVGGGTVRDLVLDNGPVFWVSDQRYLAVAAVAGILMFIAAGRFEKRYSILLWLDATALAVAVGAGILAAKAAGAPPPIVAIMGVITGCMGGLMRDVVCNEVPLVLKHGELYVTAALAGAAVGAVALSSGTGAAIAVLLSAPVTFGLRAGSLAFGWRLPTANHPPPRTRG
ncbi:MAG: trimeric intracellular cation channel family protein [Pseudomonadota bacterium]